MCDQRLRITEKSTTECNKKAKLIRNYSDQAPREQQPAKENNLTCAVLIRIRRTFIRVHSMA